MRKFVILKKITTFDYYLIEVKGIIGLKQRTTTAVFFAAAMIGGIFFSKNTFILLFTALAAGCLWEYFGLNVKENENKRKDLVRRCCATTFGLVPVVLLTASLYGRVWTANDWAVAGLSLLLALLFQGISELYFANEAPFEKMGQSVFALVYIGIPFALTIWMGLKGGFTPWLPFGILWLNWTNDSGAYLAGNRFGKKLLFPRISPKKTWEGFFGGFALTILSALVLWHFTGDLLHGIDWVVIAVIVSVIGTLGDLVESMLKRSLAIKDSGNLLPGHGGLLDRFDAFIFVQPFIAVYLLVTKTLVEHFA